MSEAKTGLALLREPFPDHQISKLPKPTKKQTDEVKADYKKGIRCKVCGAWHHPDVVHLDYVGHAALTNRLLDADPGWSWEPAAVESSGHPIMDGQGGMWIRLTVCGVTRLGYGHAGDKSGGDAVKEVIGDALRNAAMRFGAALDLWHKGVLHADAAADGNERSAWLEDRRRAFLGALNTGELKRLHAGAVELAIQNNDSEAVDLLNAWAEEKRSQAKPKAVA